jgi:hypothetical protein
LAALLAIIAAQVILNGRRESLIYSILACAGLFAVLAIVVDWRKGLYLFIMWMMFEDLSRKYMGNNMFIYFGKDLLLAIMYVSFFAALRRKRVQSFKPPFLLPLSLFFWFALLQVFNPYSQSLFLGILGMKLYFYYIPLMFLGYGLVESERDVQRFFRFTFVIGCIIAGLGIAQAILGHTFLNPDVPAEDIRLLSTLYRQAPISGQQLYRPTSVFVSDGRFASYLFLIWLVGLGFGAFLLLHKAKHGKLLTVLTLSIVTVAIVLSGSRGAVMWSGGAAAICIAAFLGGVRRGQHQAGRIVRAVHFVMVVGGVGVLLLSITNPKALGSRMAFYTETLGINSPKSELLYRTGEYPLQNFLTAFDDSHWLEGNGIGTASLGRQYVKRILQIDLRNMGVENGYGTIVVEIGIAGLILWIVWTSTLAWSCWRVARRLKKTKWFPLGFSIFFYVTLLFIPMFYVSSTATQNFVNCIYAWVLVGVLFRLPQIAEKSQSLDRANTGLRTR